MMTTTLPIVGDTPYPSVCLESRLSPDANRVKRETIVASSTAINRDKRHCACVFTIFSFLQMLGHLSPTCILRFIYDKNENKTPLRMRMDVFADGGDTYIVPRACQASPHVYYETSTAKTRTKRHCACVWMCLQMVGTPISYHKPATIVHMYLTRHLRQKQGQNAIAHAYGFVCRWWGHLYRTTSLPR